MIHGYKIEERRKLKADIDKAKTRLQKQNTAKRYGDKGRQVKATCRKDKRAYNNQSAADAEEAARKGDVRRLYKTRILDGRRPNQINQYTVVQEISLRRRKNNSPARKST